MGTMGKIIGALAATAIIFSILAYFIIGWLFEALGGFAWLLLFGLLLLTIAGVIFIGPEIIAFFGLSAELAGTVGKLNTAKGLLNRNVSSPRTPAPGAPPAPTTPLNIGALIKNIILIAAIGVIFYLLATNLGLTTAPTLLTILIVGGLIFGALRGVGICVLALWVVTFLAIEGIIFWLTSYFPIATIPLILFVILIAFKRPTINGRPTKAVGLLVLLTTLVLASLIYGTDTFKPYLSSGSQLQKAFDAQRDSWYGVYNAFVTSVPGLFKSGQLQVQRQISMATGDYETGVEAQSTKQLGVFLENLGMTETQVRTDGVVDFYARLRAESFTTSANAEPLLITVRCYDDKTNKTGAIRPQETFTVEEYENIDIDCLMDARELAIGSNTLALEASFTFTTSAFLKSYFMDQETIRTYTRQREDPLDAFQITDKNPTAVYTAGPMRIGMNAGKQPLALVADREEGPTLSLTLERAWLDGELLSLDELSITVPPGLQIESISGEKPGNLCTSSSTQEQVCTFGPDFIEKIVTDLKKPFTTLRVFTKKKDTAKLLGGAPLAIRSFKTDIRYTYRIKKTQTVLVKEAA